MMLPYVLIIQFAVGALIGFVAAKAFRYILALIAGLLLSVVIGAITISYDPAVIEGILRCIGGNVWSTLSWFSFVGGPYVVGVLVGSIAGLLSK